MHISWLFYFRHKDASPEPRQNEIHIPRNQQIWNTVLMGLWDSKIELCYIASSFHCHTFWLEFKMLLPPAKKQNTLACIRETQVHKLWTKVYSQKGLTAMMFTWATFIKYHHNNHLITLKVSKSTYSEGLTLQRLPTTPHTPQKRGKVKVNTKKNKFFFFYLLHNIRALR